MQRVKYPTFPMALFWVLLLTGCATVSFDQPKSYSQAITDFEGTTLGKYASFNVEMQEGLSGFYPLEKGLDALGARLRLAETRDLAQNSPATFWPVPRQERRVATALPLHGLSA